MSAAAAVAAVFAVVVRAGRQLETIQAIVRRRGNVSHGPAAAAATAATVSAAFGVAVTVAPAVLPVAQRRPGKQRVLMLISDTGGGHRASANALATVRPDPGLTLTGNGIAVAPVRTLGVFSNPLWCFSGRGEVFWRE